MTATSDNFRTVNRMGKELTSFPEGNATWAISFTAFIMVKACWSLTTVGATSGNGKMDYATDMASSMIKMERWKEKVNG